MTYPNFTLQDAPWRTHLEAELARLEGAAFALTFVNGAAALLALAGLVRPGERVLVSEDAPGLLDAWNDAGVAVERLPLEDLAQADMSGVKMVWTPEASSELRTATRSAGALLVLDSTHQPGAGLRGADLLVYGHAAQLSGHGDLELACLIGSDDVLRAPLEGSRFAPGELESLLVLRALPTLQLRLERQQSSAAQLAARLAELPGVRAARLEDPHHPISLIHLELDDLGRLHHLRMFRGAALGCTTSGYRLQGNRALLSIGLEDPEELMSDLEAALRSAEELPAGEPEVVVETDEGTETRADVEARPEPGDAEPSILMPVVTARQDPTEGMSDPERQRYEQLRDWRNAEARRLEVSRFIVASNATLADIARQRPRSLEELQAVKGMGPERVRRYGQAILDVLRGVGA
ncbi:hypothetical protein HNR42_002221 [Deinobacterium chartae]|uniref:HRDC domain-containing protein n=1 Tax=Deinobacterium chartae TaxID=521158 RepID=A0A841I121_9DEIO|nr:HRDC domain-containing protein [Deinobacterium chartae]MBB6098786.1 hypothetical protein [Deinobacterium chartae]